MSEWWTYRLSDFLMFSPRTYWRLVQDYDAAFWPAQLVVLALVLVAIAVALRGSRAWTAAASLLFALAWANVAWSFFAGRYSEIFTGAMHLAAAAGIQAAAMAVAAAVARAPEKTSVAAWIALASLVIYPALTALGLARPAPVAEWFGFMPDPTALATVFFVWATQRSMALRIGLAAIPVAVLAVGWATLVNLAGV